MAGKETGRSRPERIGKPREIARPTAARDQVEASPQSVFSHDTPSDSDGQMVATNRPLKGVSFAQSSDVTAAGRAYLRRQERRNIQVAEWQGYEVDGEHRLREVGSTGAAYRPVVDQLRSIVASGEVDAVFIESSDRLYRDAWAEACSTDIALSTALSRGSVDRVVGAGLFPARVPRCYRSPSG